MLPYYGIDISEGIYVNKTNLSKECDICHYWHFKACVRYFLSNFYFFTK